MRRCYDYLLTTGLMLVLMLFVVAVSAAAPIVTGIRQLEGGDTPRFDIKANESFTYEAYQMPQVLRYVVDLHNVEPGMVSNLTKLDTPTVKRVLLQQKNLNGLMMTRVIFDLSREMVGRVVADEGGRRLVVAFSPPVSKSPLVTSASPPAYSATPMPSPTASVVNELPPLQKKALVPVVPERAVSPLLQEVVAMAPASTAKKVAPQPTPSRNGPTAAPTVDRSGPPKVLGVKVEPDGILVEMSGNFAKYKAFTLTRPGRLVIDLAEGGTRSTNPVTINRFGVRTVRFGFTPHQLRLVFDGTSDRIATYEIRPVAAGLKILFSNKK